MAGTRGKRKDGQTSNGKERVKWQGYVNRTISQAEKDEFSRLKMEGISFVEHTEEVLLEGYKLSLSWDSYNSAFIGALYCTEPTNGNAGWCLTARAGTTQQALERLMFIHLHLYDGDWSSALEKSGDDDRW